MLSTFPIRLSKNIISHNYGIPYNNGICKPFIVAVSIRAIRVSSGPRRIGLNSPLKNYGHCCREEFWNDSRSNERANTLRVHWPSIIGLGANRLECRELAPAFIDGKRPQTGQ